MKIKFDDFITIKTVTTKSVGPPTKSATTYYFEKASKVKSIFYRLMVV